MQIVLNLQGHRLLAGIRQTLSSGSKEVDEIKLEVDETWKGFGKIAVFCVEKKCQYTVVDEATQTAKIPAEILKNEAVITIGMVGFKDEAVMTSTLVAYQVEKGSVVTIEEPKPSIYAEILSRYADLATRLNNIIANAGDLTNNAELIDARVGADGVVYDTLGEAIRGVTGQLSEEKDNPSIYALDLVQNTLKTENLWNQGRLEINYTGGSYKYVSKEIPIEPGTYTVYVGVNGIEGLTYNYVIFGYNTINATLNGNYREFKKLQKITVDGDSPYFEGKLVVKIQISDASIFPPSGTYYVDNILVFKGDIINKPGIPLEFVEGAIFIEPSVDSKIKNKLDKIIGKNVFDKTNSKDNCFIDEDGNERTNDYSSEYFVSDYIPAKPNTPYSLSPLNKTNTGIAFYDENKIFLKCYQYNLVGDTSYLSPENTEYVKFTGKINSKDITQLEEGEVRTEYESYYDYKPLYDNSKKIETIETEIEEIKTELSLIPKDFSNRLFKKQEKKEAFGNSEIIAFSNIPNCKQNNVLSFYGNIVGDFSGKVGISHGKIEYRCGFIEVDSKNIYVYTDESTVTDTFPHGLSISDFISIVVNVTYYNKAKVKISTINGQFEKEVTWQGCRDDVLFENTDLSLKNVVATFTLNDLDKDLWCFGDSYFDFWAIKMYDLGFGNFYSDAFSGRNSAGALVSLKNAIVYEIPKKIYWCMGMNDPDSGAINERWLSATEELKTICSEKGIELIFATIPNTPTNDNSYKNQYIYDSEYEYVDINKIVGADENPNWYSGLLHTDNVHPSTYGTNLIIATNISHFPEMKNQ